MTEINANRGHSMTSTEMLEEASEKIGWLKPGGGKKLDWHADHETREHAIEAEKNASPLDVLREAAVDTLKEAAMEGAKEGLKKGAEKMVSSGRVVTEGGPQASWASRLLSKAGSAAFLEGSIGIGMVGAGVASLVVLKKAIDQGDFKAHATDLDMIDDAATQVLDLDPGFKKADHAERKDTDTGALQRFMKESDFGKSHLPAMQAEADEGMRAAMRARACGGREEYARALKGDERAKFLDQIVHNVAFSKGFESVMWAVAQEDGEKRLDAIRKGLDARDPRAGATVTIRG